MSVFLSPSISMPAHAATCPPLERIPIVPHSLAARNNELIKIVDQIEFLFKNSYVYAKEFETKNGFPPTPNEIEAHYSATVDWLDVEMDLFSNEIAMSAPHFRDSFEVRANDLIRDLDRLLNGISSRGSTGSALSQANEIYTHVLGFAGELRGLVSIPNIIQYSKHLYEIPQFKAAITAKMKKVREHLKKNPEALSEYESAYRKIFLSPAAQRRSQESIGSRLDFIERWIGDKEIDYVMLSDRKPRWVEFKYNLHGYNQTNFPREQMEQNIQILDFLGLRESYGLEYIFVGGISQSIRADLNELKVPFKDFSNPSR